MTRNEVLRLAREAGIVYWMTPDLAVKFAALVAAAERKEILNMARGLEPGDDMVALSDLEDAIKARGKA